MENGAEEMQGICWSIECTNLKKRGINYDIVMELLGFRYGWSMNHGENVRNGTE